MAGSQGSEGPWLFDSREALARVATSPEARRKLAELAREKRRVDREEKRARARLVDATLPLADLLVAACGRSAYLVADAVLDTLGSRRDPSGYGRKVGRRPRPKSPAQDVRGTRLYSDLRADAHRLGPVFQDLWQRGERGRQELGTLVAAEDREKYGRWYSLEGIEDHDLWLHTLYMELEGWTGAGKRKRG